MQYAAEANCRLTLLDITNEVEMEVTMTTESACYGGEQTMLIIHKYGPSSITNACQHRMHL